MAKKSSVKNQNGATLGFEATLWSAADKLRGHIDAAEYKHIVLGLIFLKYISDAFEEKYSALVTCSRLGDMSAQKKSEDDGELIADKMSRLTEDVGRTV